VTEPERSGKSEPIERRALLRDAIRTSSLLSAIVCAALAIAGLPSLAIATAIGTLLGAINFVLLARGVGGAIDRTVAGVERAQRELGASDEDQLSAAGASKAGLEPKDVLGRPLGAGGPFRLALSVVLVAALLWFLPTEPAGLAMGFVITLLGASVAAHRLNKDRSPI
jgi:hypothetical protein